MRRMLYILLTASVVGMQMATAAWARQGETAVADSTGQAPELQHREPVSRLYTEEAPLVYEDMWDLWPYSFLNENGEPDGFNVELIRMMMDELGIPYVVRLKEKQQAFEDLRDGKSDLILGLSAGYHDAYGLYSKNPVTLFTQSVASARNKPVEIHSFRDLSDHQVFVNDSSLCHHLMIDYGWGENAIPYSAVKLALMKVSTEGEGAVVWNTLSLKWLINKYHIENLQVNPINMPHGEYKFMSNDPILLERLDSLYSEMDSSDKLVALRNKWFYPEHHTEQLPQWVWWLAAGAGILALILGIYAIAYHTQAKRLGELNEKRNRRLALILETSQVRVWTYLVEEQLFEWHNERGQVAYTYTADEFAQRYRPEEFRKLTQALQQLATAGKPQSAEGKEEEVKLSLRAKDTEDGDAEEKDFDVVLSVLRRNKEGKPTVILGTKQDVTELRQRQRKTEEAVQRYWAIFDMALQGHIRFDADGILVNINPTACQMFGCCRDEILSERVSYRDLFDMADTEMNQLDGQTVMRTFNFPDMPQEERKVHSCRRSEKLICQIDFVTYHDNTGQLAGCFAMCRDLTLMHAKREEMHQLQQQVKTNSDTLTNYFTKIDTLLQDGQLRIASYSPDSHTLTIFRRMNEVQHSLTQTRCMTLVDESAQNKAMHLFNDLDERIDKELRFDIKTCLSRHGQYPLHFMFSFIPLHDETDRVVEYFGVCQDITEQKSTDFQLLHEAQKVQEVENTKTSFINNMVQEIRTPMTAITAAAEHLSPQHDDAQSATHCDVILKNSTYLLHLIDNILYLSRLEAHMIEVVKKPCDFVDTFTTYCVPGRLKSDDVSFITESPYEQLIVNIDSQMVGNVIERVVENAIQHTQHGFIRARYDYIGRRLMISIEDTGDGIQQEELNRLNAENTAGARTSNGLGIAICKELLTQMGGHLEINSEEGLGTTVWITIPCQASTIKRKKMA